MTREQADAHAAELNERDGGKTWFVRADGDEFEVVHVNVPGFKPKGPLKTTTEAKPRPRDLDDPRTTYDKNVGGPWAV